MNLRNSPDPPRLGRFAQLSIRDKLLVLVLMPLLGVLPLLGAILLWWSSEVLDRVLVTKVRADLAVAQGYFEHVLGEVGASTATIAESHQLHQALARGDAPGALLERMRERSGLDFVALRDAGGRLLATHHGASPYATRLPGTPAEVSSVELIDMEALHELGPELLPRVAVHLLPTRNAAPTERALETRAMVLQALRAVRDDDGKVLAWVHAGLLLNRNLEFIDHINTIVYPQGSLPFGSQGTATLFLDDVRITTNVRLFGEQAAERAIGTRVSSTVRDTVLGEGRTWLDRAFVVNDWYVSGYEPLRDGAGRRVGMLYVGYLERPFVWLKYGALAAIGVLFFAVMIAAAWVSLRWARSIFRPLEQMESTMARVEAGALDARVGAVASGDEIARLAGHLDRLLDVVGEKTSELQRWNAELDAKVAERTRELEHAQAQLVRSEKLATVGQLSAGIAHEVNNPVAVIQGNLDLMRDILGPAAAPVRAELALVDQQVERIRLIVTRLLQFARPGEYAGYVEAVPLAPVLEDCLVLAAHRLSQTQIAVQRDFRASGSAAINRLELQQVCLNLIVNAIDAMPDGGTLRLGTRDAGAEWVEIVVADTGAGLSAEAHARLFQPFATSKKDGTGLGLWISRSLLERYGGEILARNCADTLGAEFIVRLATSMPEP